MSTSPAACVQLRGPQQSDVPCAESALDPADPTSETLFVDVFMVKMMSTQRLKNLLIQSKSGVIGLPFGDPKKALTWTMIGALETPFVVNMEGKLPVPLQAYRVAERQCLGCPGKAFSPSQGQGRGCLR